MSAMDNIFTIFLVTGVILMVYHGYLAWITRASQKNWSREQTIRYALAGLWYYVMVICFVWLFAVPESPQIQLNLSDLQNAEDPNVFLADRVNQFNSAMSVHWGKFTIYRYGEASLHLRWGLHDGKDAGQTLLP